ncbi:MAG: D-alanine--D-alanine ligase [Deltaproteobacteria bacterium]|nr:D-alanine--D-alanine ligase [Deltaproteobacteria bacterium]
MRVGLVFGGRSVEHLVSVRSARAIAAALAEAGHDVVPLGISEDGHLLAESAAKEVLDSDTAVLPVLHNTSVVKSFAAAFAENFANVDVVFPIVHGTYGEDGKLQGLLEMLDLPYVGAPTAASAIAMDKAVCKEVLAAHGLPVVEHHLVCAADFSKNASNVVGNILQNESLKGFPLFVKPSVGGSSVGCKKANNEEELHAALKFALGFHPVALVERLVQGRELECAVLGGTTPEASCIGEIVPGSDFYDYADKYVNDDAGLLAPAPLGEKTGALLQEKAKDAFLAVGAHGMARVDFFLESSLDDDDDNNDVQKDKTPRLLINEINTLPGFTRISMYPRLWQESGRPMKVLVNDLVNLAIARHEENNRMNASIRDWVESQKS